MKPWERDTAPKRPQKLRQLSNPIIALQTVQRLYGATANIPMRFSSARPLRRDDVGLELCDPSFRWVCHYRLPITDHTIFVLLSSRGWRKKCLAYFSDSLHALREFFIVQPVVLIGGGELRMHVARGREV